MSQYFDVLIRHTVEEKKNPILILRFEDMVSNKQPQLTSLARFLTDMDDISGTNIERRVLEIAGKPIETYKLKESTVKFNKNANKYTAEQIEYVKEKLGRWLHYFGYVDTGDNWTGFFKYDSVNPEWEAQNYGFAKNNEEAIKRVAECGGQLDTKYQINNHPECFPSLDAFSALKVTEPGRLWSRKMLNIGASKE